MFSPLIYFSLYRKLPSPGAPYSPIVIMPKRDPNGPPVQFFDASGHPCSYGQCLYISQPSNFNAPPGFEFVSGHAPPSSEAEWLAQQPTGRNTLSPTITDALPYPSIPIGSSVPPFAGPAHIDADTPLTSINGDLSAYIIIRGHDGFYVQPPKSLRFHRATNFLINLIAIKHTLQSGQDEMRSILFDVDIPSQVHCSLEIPSSRLKFILTEVLDQICEARILRGGNLGAFEPELQDLLRQEILLCPHLYEIRESGWFVSPSGHYCFAEDGSPQTDSTLCFRTGFSFLRGEQQRPPHQVASDAWRILALSKQSRTIYVPFLYAHLALMWRLFTEAGHRPNFLLFIEGPTGSLKTAVASLLFNFSGQPEVNVPASFRDTAASMEISFDAYRDRVLLVDDFCPTSDRTSQRDLNNKLERLVRFFGDGKSRSRATPNMETATEKKPCGLVAITGEDSAGSQSSLLRCLFLRVDRDTFDKDLLRRFQEDPSLWTEHLAFFVESLAPRAKELIQMIREKFPSYREMGSHYLKEKRSIDTFAYLSLTAEIVVQELHQLLQLDYTTCIQEFHQAILDACQASEAKANAADPVQIFSQTLLELLQQGEVFMGTIPQFLENPNKYIGVTTESCWYLWPKGAFKSISDAYSMTGRTFPLSMQALWGALDAKGVLIPTETMRKGVPHKEYGTKVSFGNRPRMLKILPQRLRELAYPAE